MNNPKNTIKFSKKSKKPIFLNGVKYTPFKLSDLPKKFGFIYDEDNDQDGYYQWFNLRGLTYINL